MKKKILFLLLLVCGFRYGFAQVEVSHVSAKDFKAIGFSGFLNFALPVSEANYLTVEGGLQYFATEAESMGLFPVLLGYRYTLDQSGWGLYAEPFGGYSFGGSTMYVYDNNSPVADAEGNFIYEKVAGPTAGVGLGYLFEPGRSVQFNVALRYSHTFAPAAANMFALRLSHAFSFRRRDAY